MKTQLSLLSAQAAPHALAYRGVGGEAAPKVRPRGCEGQSIIRNKL